MSIGIALYKNCATYKPRTVHAWQFTVERTLLDLPTYLQEAVEARPGIGGCVRFYLNGTGSHANGFWATAPHMAFVDKDGVISRWIEGAVVLVDRWPVQVMAMNDFERQYEQVEE
mgnify:CR=1 FL=1